MATKNDENQMLYCSFCGRSQNQVKRLIIGPKDVHICDECIGLCTEIIEAERRFLRRRMKMPRLSMTIVWSIS